MRRAPVIAVLILFVSPWSLPEASSADAPMRITNSDFRASADGTPGWGWWSRTGEGSAVLAADRGRDGAPAARVHYPGPRDFAFTNASRFSVEAGKWYRATAWVRPIEGHIELAVVGLKGNELVDWRLGSGTTTDAQRGQWVQLAAAAFVPDGCDTIYVRFVGQGPVEALIDDVAITPWDWRQADRPKVEGFARERVVEALDRGLVARRIDGETVYISWRLLESDPEDVGFQVVFLDDNGQPRVANDRPARNTTDFVAKISGSPRQWGVAPWGSALEGLSYVAEVSAPADRPVQVIRLAEGRTFQKVGIGDLNGDGRYDYVLKTPNANVDPYIEYWKPSPGTYLLEAYTHDGEPMWQIDLGWSIEQGIWYSPYLVYDLNGDGRAEVIAKTGEGDPRDTDGRVQTGPEYVTIFDGLTGQPICRENWIPREGFGPTGNDYNRSSRNQLGIAYLDGKTPCLIVQRGTYDHMVAVAYQLNGDQLEELWRWDNGNLPRHFRGQGAHWMHGADVDGDGRDEVILGSIVLDDNGGILWSTGLGHPDHCYVGDIDPTRPGLEIYYGIETRAQKNGMCLVDAATGEILWGHDQPTLHIHATGLCADIDASSPGWECYSGERDLPEDRWLRDAKGNILLKGDLGGLSPRPVYWDADLQREIPRGNRIVNYPDGTEAGRIEGSLIQVADILGDWREEMIVSVPGEMRIYMTTIPAADRRPCLMQDPIYRNNVAHGAMGYTQVPMLSYDPASRASR